MISDSDNLQRILDALNRDHQQEMTMGQRIKATEVEAALTDAGHAPSSWSSDDWEPGYQAKQIGPRLIHVSHDGPGAVHALNGYTIALRAAGFHVVAFQQQRVVRQQLAVTRP